MTQKHNISQELSVTEITNIVNSVIRKYWRGYQPYIIDNYINRHVFEVSLVGLALGGIKGKTVVDVGGGWGAFSASCSALGMKAMLVDDFGDPGMSDGRDPRQSLPGDYDVRIIRRDVVKDGLGLPAESVDAVTSFDMIEHLNTSPKKFFHDAMRVLIPGGVFLLGVPNCVNLRKRITVPLGRGQWSDFSEWYDAPVFRGHIREPDVQDLRKIAKDISLCDCKIIGRNWSGYDHTSTLLRAVCRVTDRILRWIPSLCSDLYLLGRKRKDQT